jgi:DNA-binding XRE family transcriptional regulator
MLLVTGADLRAKRHLLGMSQAALATALGVSPNTVARWERGEMKIARPELLEVSMKNLAEVGKMSCYDRTMQLASEGNGLALVLLNSCYQYVRKQGNSEVVFKTKYVLGGLPVINLNTLTARGLVEKVGSTSRGAYYRMPDLEGVGKALRTLGIDESAIAKV